MLIGVDYHPSFQTIAFFVQETGEYGEQELNHSDDKGLSEFAEKPIPPERQEKLKQMLTDFQGAEQNVKPLWDSGVLIAAGTPASDHRCDEKRRIDHECRQGVGHAGIWKTRQYPPH